ncbi:hypothetical protein D3C71_1353910 [compost metagenome]
MHVDAFGLVGINGQLVAVIGGDIHQQSGANFGRNAQSCHVLALALGVLDEAQQLCIHRLCDARVQYAYGELERAAPALWDHLPPFPDLKQIAQGFYDATQRPDGALVFMDKERIAHRIALGLYGPSFVPAVNGTLPCQPSEQVRRHGFCSVHQPQGDGHALNIGACRRGASLQRCGAARQQWAAISHCLSPRRRADQWRCRCPLGYGLGQCPLQAPAAPGVRRLPHARRP